MVNWENTIWLWGLCGIPVLILLTVVASGRQRKALLQFVAAPMQRRLAPGHNATRSAIRGICLIAGLTALILALARPRWGTYMLEMRGTGTDIVFVLDTSRSMLAEDVAPSRLERAKADISKMIDQMQGGERVSLLAFAGAPVLRVPLTEDLDFFRDALRRIDRETAPGGGSRIGEAIMLALKTAEKRPNRSQTIVLISDGEEHGAFPTEAARTAAERGVRIVTIGIGDPDNGAPIPILGTSGPRPLQYQGRVVKTVLHEDLLRSLADKTGGRYIAARTGSYDTASVLPTNLVPTGGTDVLKRQRLRERFQVLVLIALVCLFLEALIPARGRVPQLTR